MHNIKIERQGHLLVLTIDTRAHGRPSATGRTQCIASTEGNVEVPGTDLKLGLNIFRSRQPQTIPFVGLAEAIAQVMQAPVTSAAVTINDHTCPGCHNTKCSKSEKTCWKCGGAL